MNVRKPFVPYSATKRVVEYARHVLYQDKGIVVLNKLPGLVCQGDVSRHTPADGSEPKSAPEVPDDFTKVLTNLKSRFELPTLPYPVHRLDKLTTGALVFAKTLPRARDLAQQFQGGTVHKTYLALVRGGAKTFATNNHGKIVAPLAFKDGRVLTARWDGAKHAETDWEVIATSDKVPVSLLRLRLHTGRKHQLRVHLAETLNTPILGDDLYCKAPIATSIKLETTLPPRRLMLHASNVSFFRFRASGPHRRFRLGITAPLPKDFRLICEDLEFLVDENAADVDEEFPLLEEPQPPKKGSSSSKPPLLRKIRGLTRREMEGGVFVDGVHLPEGEVPDIGGKWMKKKLQASQDQF